MKGGSLRHYITIQSRSEALNEAGETEWFFTDWQPMWASIEPIAGREFLQAAQIGSNLSDKIRIRYFPGVTPKMRAKHAYTFGATSFIDYYDIETVIHINERFREMHLMCVKRESEGYRSEGTMPIQFEPELLFAGSGLGAWYDPSDLSTVFQDAAGTIPAEVDGPVGRINDKSGNDLDRTQSDEAKRPLLKNSGALYWLKYDGVDDFMQAGPIDMAALPAVSLSMAVRPVGPTSSAIAIVHPIPHAVPGRLLLAATAADKATVYLFDAAVVTGNVGEFSLPFASRTVLTVEGNLAGAGQQADPKNVSALVNGAAVSITSIANELSTDTGLGPNRYLTFGSVAGIAAYSAMEEYGSIFLTRQLSVAERALVTTYLRAKANI